MVKLEKKNIARLVLQGISILGILFGLSLFCCATPIISWIQEERSNLAIQFDLLIFSRVLLIPGVFLIFGIYLIFTSCLLFRQREYGAIKIISWFLALISFGLVLPLVKVLKTTTDNEKTARLIEDIFYVASLLFFMLVYLICVKLLKRLLKVSYRPKKISGTQNSIDKQ